MSGDGRREMLRKRWDNKERETGVVRAKGEMATVIVFQAGEVGVVGGSQIWEICKENAELRIPVYIC